MTSHSWIGMLLNSRRRDSQSYSIPRPSGPAARRSSAKTRASRKVFVEQLEERTLLSGAAPGTNRLAEAYGQMPLSFEANQGQTDPAVQFLSRGSGYTLFLTPSAAVLSLQTPVPHDLLNSGNGPAAAGDVLRLSVVGANAAPQVIGLDGQATKSNYFIGNDPSRWRSNVSNYGKVEYQGIYPGIDLYYYGNQRQLEYDFAVAPGADPRIITLAFDGAQGLALNDQGELVVHTAGGDLVEHAPVLYQQAAGVREAVSGRYVLQGQDQVGFQVDAYDTSRPLVIDPVLSYATYLGGSSVDYGTGIAVDASGNAYVTGFTGSSNFPTTAGAFQMHLGGSTSQNAFVAKINSTGTALLYSTYLGGSGHDVGTGIAVDASGNAYVTGFTSSSNFPTTSGALQTGSGGNFDAFVAKINSSGTALLYATYLGGSGADGGFAIAVDASGNAYVTGSTTSSNFPTTSGVLQKSYGGGDHDAFVAKLNSTGTALLYATYLGGSGDDVGTGIAVDASGNAYVTGRTFSSNFPTTSGALQTGSGGSSDAFVAKINSTGTTLVYGTYLGGSSYDAGYGIAVDASGNAYVTGWTTSSNFPTTSGAFQTAYGGNGDAFVAKLNSTGTALLYATYLGGSGDDEGFAIAVDASGNAYVTGWTTSSNFPTTSGALQTRSGGSYDAFVAKINSTGTTLLYGTYLGGSSVDYGTGIAVDASGNAYVIGTTLSSDFPTTSGSLQTVLGGSQNAFVAKIPIPLTTTTTVSASVSASVYGQVVTFTATVMNTSSSATPPGSIQFSIDGSAVGSAQSLSSGQATYTTSATQLGAGQHTVTAVYTSSDNRFTGSSGTLTQTVNRAALTVTANSRSKTYGQSVTFAGTEFSTTGLLNGDTVSSVSLTSAGAAATAPVSGSPYDIVASAAVGTGVGNYSINYVNGKLTVNKAPLTVTANSSSKIYGQSVTFTGSEFTTSGLLNSDMVTSVTLTSAGASPTAVVSGSPYPIIPSAAVGTGLGNYTISYVNGKLSVNPAHTLVTLVSSANPSVPGQSIALTAIVSPVAPGGGTPTGSVNFTDQTTHTSLGTVPLSGGRATLTTTAVAALGNHSLIATYTNTDGDFTPPSTPTTLIQQVLEVVREPAGVLYVGGTPSSSHIEVALDDSQVIVTLHDDSPDFRTPLQGLTMLVVYDQGDGAHIEVDHDLLLPAVLFAGNGADTHIEGGGGPTVEVGGKGDGHLEGGMGRNILIAGRGAGHLEGKGGDDILIGGYTDYDANLAALESILTEWNSTDSFARRTTLLTSYFNTSTVHDNGVVNHLEGGEGTNWFFASLRDKLDEHDPGDLIVNIF